MWKKPLFFKGSLILLLLVFFIQSLAYGSETLYWLNESEREWLNNHPVIRYAYDPNYPPFEFRDENGQAQGIGIEVLKELESKLGVDIEIHYVGEWDKVMESLIDKDVDLISATPTEERMEHMTFSTSYLSIPTGIIVREGNTDVETIHDLDGRYVSTVKGWFWNEVISQRHPEIHLKVYDTVEDALNAVLYGDVDATIQDFGTASYHISTYKISNLKVVDKYDMPQELAFAVREDYEALIPILNKLIPRISEETEAINDQWIKLKYDEINDNTNLIRMLIIIFATFVVLLLWTVSLRLQVRRKTKELKAELLHSEEMKNEIESVNAKLRQSEKEIRAILDADPSSIFVKDREGRFKLANRAAAQTVGVDAEDMIGKTMEDFKERIDTASLRAMKEAEDKLFSGQKDTEVYMVRLNDGKGNEFIHSVKKLPIVDDDGSIDYLLSVASDVTELHNKNEALKQSLENLKKARGQLLEQEKWAAIGAFVAGIAHDVNSPLGSSITITSHAKRMLEVSKVALEDGTLKRSQLMEFYDDMEESIHMLESHLDHAANLIQNFKSVSVHQISEVDEDFDLCEYLSRIALGMKYECKLKGVLVTVSCKESIQYRGAPGFISQIMTNLINNSLIHGYNDKGGVIDISLSEVEGGVQILYKDDGEGMDQDTADKIFTPFFTTKRDEGGSGLGMHIVHTLITEKLGGTIDLGTHVGKGVEFKIFLPKDKQQEKEDSNI